MFLTMRLNVVYCRHGTYGMVRRGSFYGISSSLSWKSFNMKHSTFWILTYSREHLGMKNKNYRSSWAIRSYRLFQKQIECRIYGEKSSSELSTISLTAQHFTQKCLCSWAASLKQSSIHDRHLTLPCMHCGTTLGGNLFIRRFIEIGNWNNTVSKVVESF